MEKPHGGSGWQPRWSSSQRPEIIARYTSEGTPTQPHPAQLGIFLIEVRDIVGLSRAISVLSYQNSWPLETTIEKTVIVELLKLQSVGDGL